MTRRKVLILGLVCMALAAAGGTLAGRWFRPKVAAEPGTPTILSINPQYLNFGEVWATDRFNWQLPVRNETQEKLSLVRLVGNCSCLSIDGLPLRLGPGETAFLNLKLDLSRRCDAVDNLDPQPYRIILSGTARRGQTEHEVAWELTGQARPTVRLTHRAIDFGRLWTPTLPVERTVGIRSPKEIERVDTQVADMSGCMAATISLPASDGIPKLLVRLRRLPPPGRYHAEVELRPVTKAGEQLAPTRLPVDWEVLHEIQPDTSVLDCGTQPVGGVWDGTVTLTSLAGRPFRVTGWKPGSGGKCPTLELPTARSVTGTTVKVKQRIEMAGDQMSEFSITGLVDDAAPFEVKCRVHYYGLAPSGP